jgi:hypothetical protein
MWDIDHSRKNLLLEAEPKWAGTSLKSLVVYPQIVFQRRGPEIRGDSEEIKQFGVENYTKLLVKSVLRAFRRSESGERRWFNIENLEPNAAMLRDYRYPPRVFWRHSILELRKRFVQQKRASFVLRYMTDKDRRLSLNTLDNWDQRLTFTGSQIGIGSHTPQIRCSHEIGKTRRALAKIAVNVLAECCPNTPVDKRHFGDVIAAIVGMSPVETLYGGFVWPSDVDSIKCQDGGHAFRLLYMDGHWHVFSSFFGGRVGFFMRIVGPNCEQWSTAHVLAPLRSSDWTIRASTILQPPLSVRFARGLGEIIPTVEFISTSSEIHSVLRRRPK